MTHSDKAIQPVSIPPYLLAQVQAGKTVLVLGAGASIGASHPTGRHSPTGKDLARLLAKEFLGGHHAKDSLSSVADMAIAASDLRAVQRFIATQFQDFSPGAHHKLLPTFSWYGIATLNYDEIVEKAFEHAQRPISAIINNNDASKLQAAATEPSTTILLKLHGCITRADDVAIPLILTPSQYADHRANRESLFSTLEQWAADHILIFCGTTIDDSDVHLLLRQVMTTNQDVRPLYYLVEPNASEFQVRRWASHRIEVIPATFSNFLQALDRATPGIARVVSVQDDGAPVLSALGLTRLSLRKESREVLESTFQVVDSMLTSPSMEASLFYRGATGGWSPILQELDCRRELIDVVLIDVVLSSEVSRAADLVVIKAEAGAGKSVFLRRLAWCTAIEHGQLSLWVTAADSLDDRVLEVIAPAIKERVFVFVDDLAQHGNSIARFLSRARKLGVHLTVIGVERTNRWNTLGGPLLPYVDDTSDYDLPRLTGREIRTLLNLLSRHGSLGQLSRLTPDEQYDEFSRVADRQLLVALHEATQGKPLEEILKDEYEELTPDVAQSLYLTVCLLNRTGTPIRAGLIARVHGISFDDFRDRFFKPLEHVVMAKQTRGGRDIEYTARHPVIADLVFRQVLSDPEALYERIAMVLEHLNTLYSSDQSSFRDLVKARNLLDLFTDQRMIDQLYDLAESTAPSDGHVFLQRARFEMRRDSPSFDRARELVRKSEELLPDNVFVRHVYAELEYERAERATNALQREAALKEADRHLQDLYRRSTSPHPFHTKCKIDLLRLKAVLQNPDTEDEERVQAIQRAEKAVWAALQQWPEDSFILESESRLAQLLKEDDRALRALERAAASNLRNATIVSRLSRSYRETGQADKAHELLRQASAVNPSERRYHYERARLLMDDGGDGAQIEALLRKSFTEGDRNRLVQFLHARQMYMNGKEREAKDRFKLLSAQGFSGRNTPRNKWMWQLDGDVVTCKGKVCRVNRNSGFVERHGAGEWIFVPPLEDGTNPLLEWDIGTRVRFNIGFNWRGPIALNVQIDGA